MYHTSRECVGGGWGTVHESLVFGLTFLERKQKYFFFC